MFCIWFYFNIDSASALVEVYVSGLHSQLGLSAGLFQDLWQVGQVFCARGLALAHCILVHFLAKVF